MSFSLKPKGSIRPGGADVTRRLGWARLKPGDLFVPVEKAMGLKTGEKHVVLWPLCRCKDRRWEPLSALVDRAIYSEEEAHEELRREGFPDFELWQFILMVAMANHISIDDPLNRIEFEYVNEDEKEG